MPNDQKIEEYVYTFKPSLLGYYLKNWFEDFTVKILERSIFSPYTVKHVMPGNRFNFFRDGDRSNIREIDVVINVENRGISKLIAIECKKTLSDKEIQTTNKKCREKICAINIPPIYALPLHFAAIWSMCFNFSPRIS